MDPVVHFEIPFEKIERAKEFYEKTFGWQINNVPEMNYNLITTAETDENQMIKKPGAINGGMTEKNEINKNVLITIKVSSIDDYLKTIPENGGKILMEKQTVGDMGFTAYFEDTEANIVGLWQDK